MSKTILIVDDDADTRKTIQQVLEHNGFATIRATGGKAALNKLKKLRPNLILLDIMMPGMNGWAVCSQIKSSVELQDIPIVFLTAKSDDMTKSMGLKGLCPF